MTTYKPGDRVLVETEVVDPGDVIGIDVDICGSAFRWSLDKVHPVPPEWAQPWPEGVWLATVAEVRDRGLWWRNSRAIEFIWDDDGDPDQWNVDHFTLDGEVWSSTDLVLAREPITPRRTVTIELPEDATGQAVRDEAERVWRDGGEG